MFLKLEFKEINLWVKQLEYLRKREDH